MTNQIIQLMLSGLIISALMMFFLWLLHLKLKNAGTVDLGWGLGFVLITAVYAVFAEGFIARRWIALFLVSLWGLRLTYYLTKRFVSWQEEDGRYQKIRASWGEHIEWKFLVFFEVQSVFQTIMSVPFLLACINPAPELNMIEISGILLCLTGIAGESIADHQMQSFKKNPDNSGKVCQEGLWYYSRHPNYFFEFVIWTGFGVFGCGSPGGWISLISPIIILYLLLKVTGIPPTEEAAVKKRGDLYRNYQRSTSPFVPLPKKKGIA